MRGHVGFESLWSMRIPVPYSLLLRDGDLAWSCGQCPLDREGGVLHSGDAVAQASVVADYLDRVIAMGGLERSDVAMIVLYHDTDDPDSLIDALRPAAPAAVFVPARVPAFYYPGMRLELDAFADRSSARRLEYLAEPSVGPAAGRTRLVEHWITPHPDERLAPTAIVDPSAQDVTMWAVQADAVGDSVSTTANGVSVRLRRADGLAGLAAVAPHVSGLVAQTEAVMEAFSEVLTEIGCSFADVVKSTTHYVGEPTPEDLHDNMQVRNRRYRSPGPASTGIRVTALNSDGALTAVNLLAVTP